MARILEGWLWGLQLDDYLFNLCLADGVPLKFPGECLTIMTFHSTTTADSGILKMLNYCYVCGEV